jgi:hypothetical protein
MHISRIYETHAHK